ncbi:unnamed protein product [Owenia fusiformis]|uniref:Uncharacterized protein n=1 Tax=Owenia fusiformis TaxID=6347 RepID=A0A8S4P3W3_OWEFU|nr:unnamed protein product [Owenia fusiformis]
MYDRLRLYLTTLGIFEGETPHSLRAGCAITLMLSGAAKSSSDIMNHIGWFSYDSVQHYSRSGIMKDSCITSEKLAKSMSSSDDPENIYKKHSCETNNIKL